MSLTQDEYIVVGTGRGEVAEAIPSTEDLSYKGKVLSTDELLKRLNKDNLFALQDYNLIIKVFEVETANWEKEDYTLAYHYKDIYSTRNFSERVREQMNYYPGMHRQTANVHSQDPFYSNGKEKSQDNLAYWDNAMDNPNSFGNALRNNQQDFDYTKIFGSDATAQERAENIGKMLKECIPCFDRKLPDSLLPDADLLEVHALNIKIRTDLLDKLKSLFDDPGFNIDICEVLNLLAGLCPEDLLAMLALLTQYLAKLNLDIKFNLDFILQLIGPILSPFLDAIADWLDKWIQLILDPMICVIDHINQTILTAQSMKVPFSEVTGSVDADLGIALPANKNISDRNISGINLGEKNGVGTSNSLEIFQTPDAQKYNPELPEVPNEEIELSYKEGIDPWQDGKNAWVGSSKDLANSWSPGLTELEREERDKQWAELKARQFKKRNKVPAPLQPDNRNGTRWSKDDIPQSDKYSHELDWSAGSYLPPERQKMPKASGEEYFIKTPIVNSLVQLRNILQASIQYVRDWFTYITQMIYDLLGTDFGWMNKKTDTSILKSRIIQIIKFIKAILEARNRNGLQCGINTNFDANQLKFITEEILNKDSQYQFEVQDDGTAKLTSPSRTNLTRNTKEGKDNSGKDGSISVEKDRQEPVDSSIIIKTCFKDVSSDELAKVKSWIADFESRGGN